MHLLKVFWVDDTQCNILNVCNPWIITYVNSVLIRMSS